MRLEQLQYFLKVAETSSITRAGKALFTSPQNISKSIKQLEDELGCQLFYRFKNGTFLTEDGLKAYDNAKIIVSQSENLKNLFNNGKSHLKSPICTSLSIMITPLFSSLIFTIFNSIFVSDYILTDICVNLQDIHNINSLLNEDLRGCRQNYDAIITCFNHDDFLTYSTLLKNDFSCYLIWQDKVCLEVSTDDKLSALDYIPLNTLKELPVVMYTSNGTQETYTERMFLEKGVKLNVRFRVPSEDGKRFAHQHMIYSILGTPTNELRPYPGHLLVPIEGDFRSDQCLLIPRYKVNQPLNQTIIQIFDDLFEIRKLF